MTIQKTNTSIKGKLSEVMEYMWQACPDVAQMTKAITACMLVTGTNKMLFSPDVYAKVDDVEIEITTEDDKLFIEIIK
jgi:hypothetical protein